MSGFMSTPDRSPLRGDGKIFFPSGSPSVFESPVGTEHSTFNAPVLNGWSDNHFGTQRFATVRSSRNLETAGTALGSGAGALENTPERTPEHATTHATARATTIHTGSLNHARLTSSAAKFGPAVQDTLHSNRRVSNIALDLDPRLDPASSLLAEPERRVSLRPDAVRQPNKDWADRHPMAALVAARIPADKKYFGLPDMDRAARTVAEPKFRLMINAVIKKYVNDLNNDLNADQAFRAQVEAAKQNIDTAAGIAAIKAAIEHKLDALRSTAAWRSAFRQVAVMISIYAHSFALGGLVGIWMAEKAPNCDDDICEPDNWKITTFVMGNLTLAVFGEWMVTVAKYGDLGTQYVYPVNYTAADPSYNVRDFFMDLSWLGFFVFHAFADGLAPAAPGGDKAWIPKMRVLTGLSAITLAAIASAGIRILGTHDHVYLDGGIEQLPAAQHMQRGNTRTKAGRARHAYRALEQDSWTATKGYASDWWEGVKHTGINPIGRNTKRVWTGIAVRFAGGMICQFPRLLGSLGIVDARKGNIGADFLLGLLWAMVVLRIVNRLQAECGPFNFEPAAVVPDRDNPNNVPSLSGDGRRDLKIEINDADVATATSGRGRLNGRKSDPARIKPEAGPATGSHNVAPDSQFQTPGVGWTRTRSSTSGPSKVNGVSGHRPPRHENKHSDTGTFVVRQFGEGLADPDTPE